VTRARAARLCCGLSLLLLAACDDLLPRIGWERMTDQARGKAYRASRFFPDGKLMRTPPDGSVPVERARLPAALSEDSRAGAYVSAPPLRVDRALLTRGRERFDTFCAPCHGIDGSGESLVARHMTLRRPPSLLVEPVASFPAGRVFRVAGGGYGLMPGFAHELPPADRWAVVAYLHALQRSQSTELASLPAALRTRAEEALP
jgi:mono/diheme cytochrome c family protein